MLDIASHLADFFASGRWIAPMMRYAFAGLAVLVAIVLAKGATRLLRRIREKSTVGRPLIYIAEKLASYALATLGVLIGLSILGVNLSSIAVFAGALGVGVGLGLQGVVREFVSGLVAIFDPFVNVGDFVELEDGIRGEIAEVGARATRIRTNDGVDVVIPNSTLVENRLTNWTLRGGLRRIHVPFGVAYGADRALVRDTVLQAVKALPFTRPDTDTRKAQVWLVGFGDSSLNFELVVWPTADAVRRPAAMQAAYTWAIDEALRLAGIEIPFPQLDVRLRDLFGREGSEAIQTLGLQPQPGGRSGQKPEPVRNDAADAVMVEDDEEMLPQPE